MNEEEAKKAVNDKCRGLPVSSEDNAQVVLDLIWQAACEWRDSQNTLWRNAAIRVGEDLHSVGPNGYYNMSAEEWLNWALNTIYSKPNFTPPTAQINHQLVDALQFVIDCQESTNGSDYQSGSALREAANMAKAALAATQMRGDA